MEFQCQGTKDGRLNFGPYGSEKLRTFLKENGPVRLHITADLPESGKLRRFYEGAVIPLITHFQEGMDHRNSEDRRNVREWMKAQFNGEMVIIGGTTHIIGKTTKGRTALNPFVERVIDWLTENYAPPAEALDAKKFKHWRDTIFPDGGPATYIEYLQELSILKK